MDKVLFRGKRTENGEWIYGFYAESGERKYILMDGFAVGYVTMKEVVPDTVGQYTGLTDKNGVKIFEGDIGRYTQTDGARLNGKRIVCTGKVVYNEKTASYAVDGRDETGVKYYDYFSIKDFEVISNMHDNTELLEV
ncbi:MAG: hypothetical protein IJD14_05130 [Christensenellaceae bacterium]|nr:hypothetical protein [Christensenellaceae bacterium]